MLMVVTVGHMWIALFMCIFSLPILMWRKAKKKTSFQVNLFGPLWIHSRGESKSKGRENASVFREINIFLLYDILTF